MLFQTLRQCKGVEVRKIKETQVNHPCKTRDGLVSLAHMFRPRPITFVRIVRSAEDIIHSFYAAKHPAFPDKRIGANSPLQIARFIALEQANTQGQWDCLPDNANANELAYESIASGVGMLGLSSENVERMEKFLMRDQTCRRGARDMVKAGIIPSRKAATTEQIEHILSLVEAVKEQHSNNDFIDCAKTE